MSSSEDIVVEAAPPCLDSSAVTMGPAANIQTIAATKSLPKLQSTQVAGTGQLQSDLVPRLKKARILRSNSGRALTNMGSFTEEKLLPIQAWYYNPHSEEDIDQKDPTLPHHYNPDQQVPLEHLQTLGVLVWTSLQTIHYKYNPFYEQLKNDRGYHFEEVVTVAPGRMENYEQKKQDFFKEHLHEHEEIRLILDGAGYEDVRDFDGRWIRIHITKGVLIVLPQGMYHRFTLDNTNYLKAVLLYQETPSRIQFDRNPCTDIMEVREQYVTTVLSRGSSLTVTSTDLRSMLDGLDEELEILRQRQEIVEATLDESNLCAEDALMAELFQPQGRSFNLPVILPAPAHLDTLEQGLASMDVDHA